MARNVDRRVRKSRVAIFKAFEELLAEKSYASITAGDVIERADVGRTTFYAHFPTKDALLDELCRDLFAHVAEPDTEASHAFAADDGVENKVLHIALHLESDAARLRPLLTGPASSLFWDSFAAQLETFFLGQIGRTVCRIRAVDDALYARHLAATLVNVFRWQLDGGAIAPEQATSMFFELSDARALAASGADESRATEEARPLDASSGVKAALKRSLLDLLEKKKLAALTVSEVARNANVGRSTFYTHYKSLDEVYADIVRDTLVDVQSIDDHFACGCGEGSGARHDEKIPFCHRLRSQKEHSCVVGDPAFARTWIDGMRKDRSLQQTIQRLKGAGLTDAQAQAVVFFQSCGCLMTARAVVGADDDWQHVQKALDQFIHAGYQAVSDGTLFADAGQPNRGAAQGSQAHGMPSGVVTPR